MLPRVSAITTRAAGLLTRQIAARTANTVVLPSASSAIARRFSSDAAAAAATATANAAAATDAKLAAEKAAAAAAAAASAAAAEAEAAEAAAAAEAVSAAAAASAAHAEDDISADDIALSESSDGFSYDFEANPVRVAVVLSGCGVYDGSEVTEAASALIHLSANGCATSCFAPDKPQMHVVNHLTGAVVEGETRNVLAESARIARGAVAPLSKLNAADFDALFFPGGFGAAKNLSTFATGGAEKLDIDADVTRAVNAFVAAKKPLGLVCIAPVIAAKLIPGVTVTLGGETESPEWPFASAAAAVKKLGATHVETSIEEAYVDAATNVVTGPAYMSGVAAPHSVFDSVGRVIDAVITIAKDQIEEAAAAAYASKTETAAPAAAEPAAAPAASAEKVAKADA